MLTCMPFHDSGTALGTRADDPPIYKDARRFEHAVADHAVFVYHP